MISLQPKVETIESLVRAEQDRQKGQFIEKVEIEQYIRKIKENSEIISHYIGGDCAGFVAFYCNNMESREAYITLVLTNPRFRGNKIAKNLVALALMAAQERGFTVCKLEVKNNNTSAIKLYESLGFSTFEQKESSKIMKVSLI